jgi:hypothetical protein
MIDAIEHVLNVANSYLAYTALTVVGLVRVKFVFSESVDCVLIKLPLPSSNMLNLLVSKICVIESLIL